MPALIVPILVGIPVLFVGGYYLVKVINPQRLWRMEMANCQVPSHAASKKARLGPFCSPEFLSGAALRECIQAASGPCVDNRGRARPGCRVGPFCLRLGFRRWERI